MVAGDVDTCATTTVSGVQCWGYNSMGQLGDGSMIDSDVPRASALGVRVAVGELHTCVLTPELGVRCVGSNFAGQLGNGSTTDSATFVDVSGLSFGVAGVAANENETCAVNTAGGVLCWGQNTVGQLGNGSTENSAVPVPVPGLTSGISAVLAMGSAHVCGLTYLTGAVHCWGHNDHGQLGDGSTTDSPVPVEVAGLSSGILAIAAGGNHTCAVTTAGALECWGENLNGQLGDGSTTDSPVPVAVPDLSSGVARVAAGGAHTCAVTTAGSVQCWGNNGSGQLGHGPGGDSAVPVPVPTLTSGVAALSSQGLGTCALTTAGRVQCWGANGYGQLGDGSTTDSAVPVSVVEP